MVNLKGYIIMIKNRIELKEYIKADEENLFRNCNKKHRIKIKITDDHTVEILRFLRFLRYEEYYRNRNRKLAELYYARKKNKLGNKLGFYVPPNCIGKGVSVYHIGSLIINGGAKIGDFCKFHGENCVGNDGIHSEAPVLGDRVDVGVGAKIIGDVRIANDIKIGAGAVVISSFEEEGITIAGIPAQKIK